jgi:hypothetical protein
MFGGSIGNFLKLSKAKTKQGFPFIDYTLILLSLPLLLAGSVFGVTFNHFLPNSIVCMILLVIQYTSVKKLFKQYKL